MNPLHVLIIDYKSEKQSLESVVQHAGFQVLTLTTMPLDIKVVAESVKPDIIMINSSVVNNGTLRFITDSMRCYPCPIILSTTVNDQASINNAVKAGVSAYVLQDIDDKSIIHIIDIASAQFEEKQKLTNELEQTKSKLQARKLVDQAKAILIKLRGYSEDEAYHTLRKLAMERNTSIGEMAKNVIAMAELMDNK